MSTSSDWTGTANLVTAPSPGAANTIQFRATDDKGNVTDPPIQITVLGVSSVTTGPVPVLTITNPPSNPITVTGDDGFVFQIAGTCTSTSGIAGLVIGSQPAALDSQGNFSVLIILSVGTNTVKCLATDIQSPPQTTEVDLVINLQPSQSGGGGGGEGVGIEVSEDQLRIGIRIHERGLE